MDDRHTRAADYLYCIHTLAWLAYEDAEEVGEPIVDDLDLLGRISDDTDDQPTPTPAAIRAVAQDLLDLAEADDLDGPPDFVVDGSQPIEPQVEAGIAKVLAGSPPDADPKLQALANAALHEQLQQAIVRAETAEAELVVRTTERDAAVRETDRIQAMVREYIDGVRFEREVTLAPTGSLIARLIEKLRKLAGA